MSRSVDLDRSGTSLSVTDVAAYLHAQGWRGSPSRAGRVTEFVAPPDDEGNTMSIVLPVSDKFEDAPVLVAHAVSVLAELMAEPIANVVRRIRTLRRDVLRVRIMARDSAGLPLHKLAGLVDQVAAVVSFSASAEKEPQPAFDKQRKIGKEFVERCLFGQTFEGSFGLSIEAPVPAAQPLLPSLEPFERRVTARVFRGLDTLRRSLELGDPGLLEEDWKEGLNANMCEAFVQMANLAGDDVLIDPVWSPLVTPPPALARMSPVSIGGHAVELLESVSRGLRTKVHGRDAELTGHIIRLHARQSKAAGNSVAEGEREIVIEGSDGLRVRLTLDFETYRKACNAHRDGRRVSVTGTLEKPGKYWVLMRPEGFRELGEDDHWRD